MTFQDVYDELHHYLTGLTCIDAHEHIPANEDMREQETDILREYCRYYAPTDLKSMGYPNYDYLMDASKPLMERWKDVEPYWNKCRHTSYIRAADTAASVLYGVPRLDSDTILAANDGFQKLLKSKASYKRIINEETRSVICLKECTIEDIEAGVDFRYFRIALRLDDIICPRYGADKLRLERFSGMRIASFQDWLDACQATLEKVYATGMMVAVKSEIAYNRDLRFERVTAHEAEQEFNRIFTPDHYILPLEDTYHIGRAFQNYMIHFILGWCNKKELTFQFHTGLMEGNRFDINDTNPALLTNLVKDYEGVRFDLLHVGIPYHQQLLFMVKAFPNVYTNLTFVPNVCEDLAAEILSKAMQLFSYTKITAYGGDCSSVDIAVGSYHATLRSVAQGLADCIVRKKLFVLDEAKYIAQHLFYHNPLEIYRLHHDLPNQAE